MNNPEINNFIPYKFLKEMFLKNGLEQKVSKEYKFLLKESVYLFIHYLITYVEEICKEKNFSKISIFNLKEALIETDFQNIINLINEEKTLQKSKIKRTLKQIK